MGTAYARVAVPTGAQGAATGERRQAAPPATRALGGAAAMLAGLPRLPIRPLPPRRNEPFFIGVAGGTASGRAAASCAALKCQLAVLRRRCGHGSLNALAPSAAGKTTVCDQIIQRLHGGCRLVSCLPTARRAPAWRRTTPPPPARGTPPPLWLTSSRTPRGLRVLPADQCVVMLSQDSFYRNLTEEDLKDVKSEGPGQPGAGARGAPHAPLGCMVLPAVPAAPRGWRARWRFRRQHAVCAASAAGHVALLLRQPADPLRPARPPLAARAAAPQATTLTRRRRLTRRPSSSA